MGQRLDKGRGHTVFAGLLAVGLVGHSGSLFALAVSQVLQPSQEDNCELICVAPQQRMR